MIPKEVPEHSKSPWITVNVGNIRKNGRPEALEVWGGIRCNTCIASWHEEETGQGVSELDLHHAAFISKACNEYDSLKEKEALLDEALGFLREYVECNDLTTFPASYTKRAANEFLGKAKDSSC